MTESTTLIGRAVEDILTIARVTKGEIPANGEKLTKSEAMTLKNKRSDCFDIARRWHFEGIKLSTAESVNVMQLIREKEGVTMENAELIFISVFHFISAVNSIRNVAEIVK